MLRLLVLFLLAPSLAFGQIPAGQQAALDRITPATLRADVSLLASDFLQGRDTPSPGLEIAARYIAAKFRAAGLQPAGDSGFFQNSEWLVTMPNGDGFSLEVGQDGDRWSVPAGAIVLPAAGPVDLDGVAMLSVSLDDPAALDRLPLDQVAGKVLVAAAPEANALRRSIGRLRRLNPACILIADPSRKIEDNGGGALHAPGSAARIALPAVLVVHDARFAELAASPSAVNAAKVSLHLGAPADRPVTLRNVAAILPGSDPKLRDTYIVLSSHYDHLGVGAPLNGDSIYNGANDDASGVAGMLAVAAALARMPVAPPRSILFLAYFGEEKGLFGSRYYAQHPLVPLDHTVGALMLEQIGRTDSDDGPRALSANITGFSFSDLPATIAEAGKLTGVRVWDEKPNGDNYFNRSDNIPLAERGVPSHTLSVTYDFPGYHQPDDEWQRIDFQNMAAVTRTVALGVLMLAEKTEPPRWDATNERARRYSDHK